MKTQRFNTPLDWNKDDVNITILGLFELILELPRNKHQRMIEIGSYMGESTMLFASSQIFKEVHTIEPFAGREEFNDEYNYSWYKVRREFEKNTRFFDNITHHDAYSYDVVDEFRDDDYDFIYIDGNHSYEDTKRDLELYLPKLKKGGIIGGHDYHEWEWPGVFRAVNEVVGTPDKNFLDDSWIKYI
tara:strand:- start:357 stop:917 length:561 start_codon:yes stop_codon:yes gene_type:complete